MYPQQQYPQPQYPAPQQPQYAPPPAPPAQYPAPQPQYPQAMPQYPAPPAPAAPAGTLDAFYGQPSTGGGPSWKFNNRPNGTSYSGIVARPVTNADIQAQTDNAGRPSTFRDGRPKFVMVVPLLVQPSAEYAEGRATWWCKGQARDELVRAMAEAGAPEGPPEAGAVITVTKVGERPIQGMNPQIQYQVTYRRPDNAAPSADQGAQQAPPPAPAAQPAPPAPVPAPQPQPQAGPPAPAAQPVPGAQPQAPAGLSPEQQQLLAKLTGG